MLQPDPVSHCYELSKTFGLCVLFDQRSGDGGGGRRGGLFFACFASTATLQTIGVCVCMCGYDKTWGSQIIAPSPPRADSLLKSHKAAPHPLSPSPKKVSPRHDLDQQAGRTKTQHWTLVVLPDGHQPLWINLAMLSKGPDHEPAEGPP